MPLTTTGKNNLISVASYTHATAFSDLGVTEITTTRQALTWAASSGGTRAISAQASVPVNAGTTVVAAGVYDAATAGNQQGFFQIGSTLRGAGTVAASTDTITSVAHTLATDDRIFFSTVGGDPLPAGLSATTLYFVRATGLTANAFTIATASGGAAVDITADGELAWYKTVPQTFAIAGNLILPATTGLVIDINAFG